MGASLAAKLAEVMGIVGRIPKRGRNEHFGYDYATEADIVEAVRSALAERHVAILWDVSELTREEVPASREGARFLTTVKLSATFIDGDSGEERSVAWFGQALDSGDKGLYKAYTGAEKYLLLKTFLLPTGDDPEQDDDEEEPPAAPPVQRAQPNGHASGRSVKNAADPASDAQKKAIFAMAKRAGVDLKTLLPQLYGVDSVARLTKGQASELIDRLDHGGLPASEPAAETAMATPEQREEMAEIARTLGATPEEIRGWMRDRYGVTDSRKLTQAQAADFLAYLTTLALPEEATA